jgi:hypothetical protein
MQTKAKRRFPATKKKTTMSSLSRIRSSTVLALAGLFGACTVACAQQHKQATERIVEGTVVSAADKPMANVVVFLEDEKTLFIKSYLTDDKGQFKFSQLSLSTDYDVWAENTVSGIHSKTKHVSTFDNKPDLTYVLKMKEK